MQILSTGDSTLIHGVSNVMTQANDSASAVARAVAGVTTTVNHHIDLASAHTDQRVKFAQATLNVIAANQTHMYETFAKATEQTNARRIRARCV